MFNAATFLTSSTSDQGSTVRIPIPKATYPGICEPLNENSFRQAEGTKEPGRWYTFLDLTWVLQVPQSVKDEIGRDRVTARQSLIVDVNEQGTGLDFSKGKNIQLNRVREAVGQNVAGQPWAPQMLGGRTALITIDHRIVKSKVEGKPDDIYDEVGSVGKLA
jgi:hypothetical protein